MAHFLVRLPQLGHQRGSVRLDFRMRMGPRQWAALVNYGVGCHLQIPRSPKQRNDNVCHTKSLQNNVVDDGARTIKRSVWLTDYPWPPRKRAASSPSMVHAATGCPEDRTQDRIAALKKNNTKITVSVDQTTRHQNKGHNNVTLFTQQRNT